MEVSDTTVSRITDKILPIAKEWQQRPLESVYAVVFLDVIHYHVRSEEQIVKKAVYIAIGINLDGSKDVLGMWVGENESAKFWVTVLNSLKNRGVEDIFIACTDNLFIACTDNLTPKSLSPDGTTGRILAPISSTPRGSPPDLYDQYHRGLQPSASESDQGKIRVSPG